MFRQQEKPYNGEQKGIAWEMIILGLGWGTFFRACETLSLLFLIAI